MQGVGCANQSGIPITRNKSHEGLRRYKPRKMYSQGVYSTRSYYDCDDRVDETLVRQEITLA